MKKVGYTKKSIQKALALFGVQLTRADSMYGVWQDAPDFMELFNEIKDHTVVKINRCFSLYEYAQYARTISGDVAEVGVYKGGTAYLFAKVFIGTQKKIYLFDTFEGMPKEKASHEYRDDSAFDDVSLGSVQTYLRAFPNIVYKKGVFPQSALDLASNRFSFVYLDADLYTSTKEGLEFFYPRLSTGGIIAVDDYGSHYWPGVQKAVHEFCEKEKTLQVITTFNQCVLIKS